MHIDADQGTVWSVVAGAALATVGGLVAGQIENRLRRREREQSAALLFGELLSALRLVIRLADEARGRGDPYGPVTAYILRAAHRETEIYDRNRELLFDVRDATLRARTHLVVIQLGLNLDGIVERIGKLADLSAPEARAAAVNDLAGSFAFLLDLHRELPDLISRFEAVAGQSFDAHDQVIDRIAGPRRGLRDSIDRAASATP